MMMFRWCIVTFALSFSLLGVGKLPASALTFTVNSLADTFTPGIDGSCGNISPIVCTLREAVYEIDAGPDASNTIYFFPSLSGTIVLSNGRLVITKNLTIDGPGSDRLSIEAQDSSEIFEIDSPGNNATVSISGLRLAHGLGTNGAAIYVQPGDSLFLTRMVFETNNASSQGGAVYCAQCGNLSISYSRFSGNNANIGGGVYAYLTPITIDHSVFEDNIGFAYYVGGGGMSLSSVTGTISDSVFVGNEASRDGGGLYSFGAAAGMLTIIDSTFLGNKAANSGGGIYLDGSGSSTILDRVTVYGNKAAGGGGITAFYQSVSIANSTISGNTASYDGGGISTALSSSVELSNVTISGNIADTSGIGASSYLGGGVAVLSSLTAKNSIIAGNATLNPSFASGSDCYSSGSVSSGGYNVIGDGTGGCAFGGNDQVGTTGSLLDPLLGPLAWNGGSTQTHALLSLSPALDQGNPGGCTWDDDADGGTTPEQTLTQDQRTAARPYTTICDSGSYEWNHCDNGISDSDEAGIDCGGSLCAACTCPGLYTAMVGINGYFTIQTAYDTAWDSVLIKTRETTSAEPLDFDRAMHITLRGGYDCSFFKIKGMTTVTSLTVTAGKLTVENLAISGP